MAGKVKAALSEAESACLDILCQIKILMDF